jgi:fumarate hydratase class II
MDDSGSFRVESDTLGEMQVPSEALYGAQTARAIANFPISGWRMPAHFVAALANIKAAYARAHGELGLLPPVLADAIVAAAEEVARGEWQDHFPVDVFQTGSGTSSNMNVNEVVAHLANRRLGGDPAAHRPVHPNDHVNLGQSSNDTVPAALRLAAAVAWQREARPALALALSHLSRLAHRHRQTVTLGRTHLTDAVPTTYGRVFEGWAARLAQAMARVDGCLPRLLELPLGGTAVGSGAGCDPRVPPRALELLRASSGFPVTLAHGAAGIQAQEAAIAFADDLAAVARVLLAVANDLRLRASGPFGGLAELRLPAVQPGSSLMPGKVNPVIPEAVAQVAIQVEGLATACRLSATLHQLDLSHANPLLAWNLDTMCRLLAGAGQVLAQRCLAGLDVDTARARALAAASPALATALATRVGYEGAAAVAREAQERGESVAAVARRLGVLPEEELEAILDLKRLAGLS